MNFADLVKDIKFEHVYFDGKKFVCDCKCDTFLVREKVFWCSDCKTKYAVEDK